MELTQGAVLPNGVTGRTSTLAHYERRRQLKELLEKGHVRPSTSSFASSVVLVPKKARGACAWIIAPLTRSQ
jgi:hypothetical protein